MNATLVLVLQILMMIILFAFLAWGLYIIWIRFQRKRENINTSKIPQLTLTAHLKSEHIKASFNNTEVILGRDPKSDFYINDETISAKHARFSYHQNRWWIEDLNSTNGTFLNKMKIEEATMITNGDELRCGLIIILITIF